jgi:hypothetical protein
MRACVCVCAFLSWCAVALLRHFGNTPLSLTARSVLSLIFFPQPCSVIVFEAPDPHLSCACMCVCLCAFRLVVKGFFTAMERSTAKGAAAPLTLRRLLDTHQATAVLSGVLYFATTGECLSSSTHTASSANVDASAALKDFFMTENPCLRSSALEVEGGSHTATETAAGITIPATNASVGTDAIFVAPRGIAPYFYRPFFADFGPLDVGCCVHFARRLRALLQAVSKLAVDAAAPASLHGSATSSTAAQTAVNSSGAGGCSSSKHSVWGTTSLRSREDATPSPQPASSLATRGSVGVHANPVTALSSSTSSSPSRTPSTLPVVICASFNAQERANTACLVGAFCMLVLGWSTAATWNRVFADVYPSFLTYRDASTGVSNYPLSLQDVWSGLEKAVQLGWVDVNTFDLASYWAGKARDFSWVVPRRFVAMSSPRDADPQRTAELLAPRLRAMNVRLIIRLNDSLYDPAPLLRLGIRHVDLPYADGSTPNDATLLQFLRTVEEHFGERVAPSSLRQLWSMPTVMGVDGGGGGGDSDTRRDRQRESPSVSAARRASPANDPRHLTRAKTAESVQHQQHQQYAACSPLHSGTFRGMPETRTAVPHAVLLGRGASNRPNSSSSSPSGTTATGELGAVAVHCLAGLGRTGTMIAVYMMRHYGFTAHGVIGWMRLCRPGSITGVQQQYLDTIERRLRPSPYVFAAQKLRDFVQTLHPTTATLRAASSSVGDAAATAALSGSDSARSGASVERAFDVARGLSTAVRVGSEGVAAAPPVLPCMTSVMPTSAAAAGVTAFQVHGNVVGDARPLTRMGSDGGQWAEGSWNGSPQGLLLRRPSPQPPQQHQQQHRNSNSSLSLSADHLDSTALDAVSSMPVLGGVVNDRQRNGCNDNTRITSLPSAAAATTAFSAAGPFTESGGSGTLGTTTAAVHTLPCVGDYKYASTYFVALERANRRFPQQSNGSAPACSARTPYAARGKVALSATAAGAAGNGNSSSSSSNTAARTRAATAGTAFVRRNSRLDSVQQQQQQQQRSSDGSYGSPNQLSRDHLFGDKRSATYQRRVSLMSMTTYRGRDADGAAAAAAATALEGDGINGSAAPTNSKWNATGKEENTVVSPRPYTTTAVDPPKPGAVPRGHDCGYTRLRKTSLKPDRGGQPAKRHLSARSSLSQLGFSLSDKAEADSDRPSFPPLSDCETVETPTPRTNLAAPSAVGAQMGETGYGALRSRLPRSTTVPEAVLPLWGRPVGRV